MLSNWSWRDPGRYASALWTWKLANHWSMSPRHPVPQHSMCSRTGQDGYLLGLGGTYLSVLAVRKRISFLVHLSLRSLSTSYPRVVMPAMEYPALFAPPTTIFYSLAISLACRKFLFRYRFRFRIDFLLKVLNGSVSILGRVRVGLNSKDGVSPV